ncbi:MAG: DNA internalization-related competence protein ComEC/Rec2 [Ignavibacteriales bacterium]|nr:DNA internalization-related competence protein ComEC/Rec2 [Ignavibacteriales bacterium]
MFNTKPAMKFLIPYCIGIILSYYYNIPLLILLLISCAVVAIYFIAGMVNRTKDKRQIIIFVLLILFGSSKMSFDSNYRSIDDISEYSNIARPVIVEGIVVELPRKSAQSIRFILNVQKIVIDSQMRNVSGDLYVSVLNSAVDESAKAKLNYGVRLRLKGEMSTVRTARNPGEFDLKYYLSLLDIHARFFPEKLDDSSLVGIEQNTFNSLFVYPVRKAVTEKLDLLIGGEEAKFLKGLIVGERSEISAEVKTAFINSGVMHILAVSGLHVAIIVLILLAVLQLMRLPEKASILITCLALVYYNYLTGNSPSVSRSVIMAVVFLIGKLLEQKTDIYNTLAVSAVILLVIDSKQLLLPGFQLSYMAVLSMVYLYPKIIYVKKYLPEKIISNRLVNFLILSFGVTLAAGIGTLPFTSIYFGKISIISFAANLIIVPLSNLILIIGMTSVAFSFASNWIGSIYAESAKLCTQIMLKMVDWFGSIPYAFSDLRLQTIDAIYFYIFIVVIFNFYKKGLRGKLAIVTLILLNVMMISSLISTLKEKPLRVTFLDVGQGDAIYIEYPEGSNMLIDAGPRTFNIDAANRFILPLLKYRQVQKIDRLVITHPDADHLGGVPSLLRQIPVSQIYESSMKCSSTLCEEYISLTDSLGLNRKIIHRGMNLYSSSTVRVYTVSPSDSGIDNKNVNNASIVLRIIHKNNSLLLMGDAEKEIDKNVTKIYGGWLKSELLKVSHHGSKTGSTDELLEYIKPSSAIISVGKYNKFGHPSPTVLNRFKERSITTHRTDIDGAIIMESDGFRWQTIQWRKE